MDLTTPFFLALLVLIASASTYLHNDMPTSTLSTSIVRLSICPSECECTEYRNSSTVTCSWISKSTTAFRLPENTRKLYLNHIDIPLEQIPWLFNQTPLLNFIRIEDSSFYILTAGLFNGLENLVTLELFDNDKFAVIEPGAFASLRALQIINIHDCGQMDLHAFQVGATLLNQTSLNTVIIGNVHKDSTPQILTTDFFKIFSDVNLRNIVLNRDYITTALPGYAQFIPGIVCLSLCMNAIIGKPAAELDLYKLDNLRILDLSQQGTASVPEYDPSLNTTCVEPLPAESEVQNISQSVINETTELLKTCPSIVPVPKNLRYLYMDRTSFFKSMEFWAVCAYPSNKIRYLDISHNNWDIDKPNIGLLRLQYLNMQNCLISSLQFHSFAHFPNLETLLLGGNPLGQFIGKGNATYPLRRLTKLVHLDLSNAGITNMSADDWSYLATVSNLNMSNNGIKTFSLRQNVSMSFLTVNLSHNSLEELPVEFRTSFDKLLNQTKCSVGDEGKKKYGKSDTSSWKNESPRIDLTGNPIICNCDTIDFLRWINSRKQYFYSFNGYSCSIQGITMTLDAVDLNKLENDCAVNVDGDKTRMIIGSVVSGLCFITFTISIIYWRHRINYYICFLPKFKLEKIFWQKFKGYGVLDNEEAYTYDVFVAYSQHNRHWVTHDLNDRLTAAGVSLCIADIVFPPGECITEIIVSELRKSQCILLVVSNEFLRSEWCHFEARMAILLRHKVMVVTMEDVSYRIMPAVIYYMMKSKTRLRFPPENPELQEKFWTNLTETLQKMKRMPTIMDSAGEPWRY